MRNYLTLLGLVTLFIFTSITFAGAVETITIHFKDQSFKTTISYDAKKDVLVPVTEAEKIFQVKIICGKKNKILVVNSKKTKYKIAVINKTCWVYLKDLSETLNYDLRINKKNNRIIILHKDRAKAIKLVSEAKVKKVKVRDITIAYKEFGKGEPLIMIMGYGSTMDVWDPVLISKLAERYRVIIFDNRGMGYTTDSGREFSIELFADDTAGLMQALKIKKAHVFGFSMGGYVAQELVLKYPAKVNKLILLSTSCGGKQVVPVPPEVVKALINPSGTSKEIGERIIRLMLPAQWLKQHPEVFDIFRRVREKSHPSIIKRQQTAMVNWKGTFDRLPQVKSPALLIAGTDDVLIAPVNAFITGQQIPRSWAVKIKGGGHGIMFQFPYEISELVLFFLQTDFRE